MIEFLLISGSIIGVIAVTRMLLGIATWAWYQKRQDEIDNLATFSCDAFHEIQNRPKPLYVRLNDIMEDHHV